MPDKRGLLSTVEVGERLGMTDQTVRRWILDGKLPATSVGNRYRIKPEDADAMIKEGPIQRATEGEAPALELPVSRPPAQRAAARPLGAGGLATASGETLR